MCQPKFLRAVASGQGLDADGPFVQLPATGIFNGVYLLQRSSNSVLSARSDAHLLASPTTVVVGDASGIGFGKAECGAHQAQASVFLTRPQPRGDWRTWLLA